MKKYRKRPIEVEAVQFTPDSTQEIADWLGPVNCGRGRDATGAIAFLQILTMEGMVIARPGDWIIRGIKGEFYPCQTDIFAATYEEVQS